MKKLLALFVVVLGFSAVSFGQATEAANASAKIIGAITLKKNVDLVFGSIAPTGTLGSVTIAPDGSRTGSNVTLVSVGTPSAASYHVTGSGSGYTIKLPADGAIKITNGTAAEDMAVNAFSCSIVSKVGDISSGTEDFTVGATLTVAASQASGTYTGTYNVTVNYN